jgi:hypothetical protein
MSDTSQNDDGLGPEGTIPATPDGVAAGYQPGGSNFEPEEDLEGVDADADGEDGEDDEITSRSPESGGGPNLDDTPDGAPASLE